ncbi:DUF5776 domain-containing protein [Levilactobacillus huananensis]|uniref:DUF5776 domain-containing protein n=1 Tax=Levilactobacillus huananensis TaxID=2486019 RepID=UPI000F78589F|nr:DUF5776 domain-containing protein [Levilactobacillus huananensis]
MNRLIHQLTISGLTLLLLGGVVSPSVAFADTTSPTPTVTAKADNQQVYPIRAMEMMYTLMSGKNGNEKLYWYPKWPTSITQKQAQDPQFIQGLNDLYPEITDIENLTRTFADSMVDISILPGESIVDYQFREVGGEEEAGMTKAEFIDNRVLTAYLPAWIIGTTAKFITGQITRSEMQTSYETNFRPKIVGIAGMEAILSVYDNLFKIEDDDLFLNNAQGLMRGSLMSAHLGSQSNEQLATIDPEAGAKQTRALITAPMANYLHPLGDGTYEIDGLVSSEFQNFSSWFEDAVTPDPDPDPTPVTSQPVTVHYVDVKGKSLAPAKRLTGNLGSSYTTSGLTIKGYKLSKVPANAKGIFTSQAQTVTYIYKPETQTGGSGATVSPKGKTIYGIKKLGLYKKPTFTKKNRLTVYAQKSRQNRPRFVVTGYTKSASGAARYKVRDVNHHSKTAGMTGYITAKKSVVAPAYYTKTPPKITVTNPKGINAYAKKDLTKKKTHYRQGQVLKVKKIVHYKLTTRFVLKNGRYVTANKKLVIAGKKTMPKRIVTKTGINRYRSTNLTKHSRTRHYRKNTVIKVTGWTYSNANNFKKRDTLRYKVSGGYVTGNSRYVQKIK